jgi:hypothetical protein
VAQDLNAFNVSFTITSTVDGTVLPPFTGLAYLRPGANTTLVLMSDNGEFAVSSLLNKQVAGSADNLKGAWISTDPATNAQIYTLVLPSTGQFRKGVSGITFSGTYNLTGTDLGGKATLYPGLEDFSLGRTPVDISLSGTGTPSAINETITTGGTSRTLPPAVPDGVANVAKTLNDLVGNYEFVDGNGKTTYVVVTMAPNGTSATLQDTAPTPTLSGSITQVATDLNAFNVRFTVTADDGTVLPLFTGLVYLRPGTPTLAILMSDNGQMGITEVLTKQ